MGNCFLCEREALLMDSHIIPKFVFKWLKETGSGYLRSGGNFNIRVQDGPTHRMLCSKCEQIFGDDEKIFATTVFYPIVNNDANVFSYTESLNRFVISVIWRLLKHYFIPSEKDPAYKKLLIELEDDYHEYLIKKTTIPKFDRIHLLCGVDVRAQDEAAEIELPKRFIHYFARQVDAGVTGNNEHKFIYLKLPRLLFIIPIQGLGEQCFLNTRIKFPDSDYLLNEASILEPLIGNYFYQRVNQLDMELSNISSTQKNKLAKVTEEKWDEVQQKDIGKILNYQQRVFNDQQDVSN
jgi:hypothetical protein